MGAVVAGSRLAGDAPPLRALECVAIDARPFAGLLRRRADELALFAGDLDELVRRVLGSDPFVRRAAEVTRDGIRLRDVVVRRRGEELAAEATVDPAALAGIAPEGVTLRLAGRTSDGQILLEGRADAFGVGVPVSVRVTAEQGTVVAVPQGLPVGRTTLFSDPRVLVDGLSLRPAGDRLVRLRVVGRVAR